MLVLHCLTTVCICMIVLLYFPEDDPSLCRLNEKTTADD